MTSPSPSQNNQTQAYHSSPSSNSSPHGHSAPISQNTASQKSFSKSILRSIQLVLLTWIATFASQYIIGYPLVLVLGVETLNTPVFLTIYSALTYLFSFFLLSILPHLLRSPLSRFKKVADFYQKHSDLMETPKKELGLSGLPTFIDILIAIVGFVVYMTLASVLTSIFSLFPWFNLSEVQDTGFSHFLTGLDRIVAFFALVICAPIAEEVIFRGWLYGKLRKDQSMILSIFSTSLIFGFLHGQWNVGVNVFALSVVMCIAREITGTIYAGTFLHILKNCLAFIFIYIVGLH